MSAAPPDSAASSPSPRPAARPAPWRARSRGASRTRPRGENGFGYDPIFFVPELGCTSAELDPERKNAISHRGQAARKARDLLKEMFGAEDGS